MTPVGLQIPAAVRFVSYEPLLEEIDPLQALQKAAFNKPFPSPDECFTGPRAYRYMMTNQQWELDWAIIGCEKLAGNKPGRFCDDESKWWAAAKSLVEQHKAAGVPVFFKQGPINGKVSHKPDEWPAWAQVQEYPLRFRED